MTNQQSTAHPDELLLQSMCDCGHRRLEHVPRARAPMLTNETFIARGRCVWKRCGCRSFIYPAKADSR